MILFVWFITLTKLSMPSNKEIAAMQKHAHEMAMKTEADWEELKKRYPDLAEADPETDTP